MSWPQLVTLPRRVGVLVATRNRADYLPVALQCVLDQSHRAERIVVVDDGSSDNTAEVVARYGKYGVEYYYVDLGRGREAGPAKRWGFEKLYDLPYVCAIDDDDYADLDYLEKLLDCMESDCRVGAAYPRLHQFGERSGLMVREYEADILSRTNVAPSTSLIRVDALKQIGGWPVLTHREHDDWAAWRRMRALGWRLKLADTIYHWRRHADSQTFRHRGAETPEGGASHNVHWCHTVDKQDLVTIAVPFCGRHQVLSRFVDAIERQSFPLGYLHFLAYDNSGCPSFGRRLKQWLATAGFASYTYVSDPTRADPNQGNTQTADGDRLTHADAVNHRCAANWARISRMVHTDLVWCLEDDVIPPPECLTRLLRAFRPEVDAVAALYAGRHSDWVAREFTSLDPLAIRDFHPAGGVEPAGAVGMGCVVVRQQVLQSTPMRSAGEGAGHRWFDWNFWADVSRQGYRVKIDGDVVCEHTGN